MIIHNAKTLAYIGDALYELYIRKHLLEQGIQGARLHDETVKFTCAPGQSLMFEKIKPHLTDQEQTIFKRGRNSELSRKPRNAPLSVHRHASGLEALFGYLHLDGDTQRINQLFTIMFSTDNG